MSDGVEPDGFNINRDVGATHTDDLAERTAKAGADLGLAFDGDADRLIMADNQATSTTVTRFVRYGARAYPNDGQILGASWER